MRATPDFDFQLGEAGEMIRETTARFADEQIMPLAEATDRNDAFHRVIGQSPDHARQPGEGFDEDQKPAADARKFMGKAVGGPYIEGHDDDDERAMDS